MSVKLELARTEVVGDATITYPVQVEMGDDETLRVNGSGPEAVPVAWPVGSVCWTGTNDNPDEMIGYGTWTSHGSVSTGESTTAYAWKRTE